MKLVVLMALTLFAVLCFIGLVVGKIDVVTVTLVIIVYSSASYKLCGKVRKHKKKEEREDASGEEI